LKLSLQFRYSLVLLGILSYICGGAVGRNCSLVCGVIAAFLAIISIEHPGVLWCETPYSLLGLVCDKYLSTVNGKFCEIRKVSRNLESMSSHFWVFIGSYGDFSHRQIFDGCLIAFC
jgi:hypothetical protein